MFAHMFDDVPDTSHSIPEPLKETGNDTYPKAPNPLNNKPPRDIRVNVNVNTKGDVDNKPIVHNDVDAGSDTTRVSDSSVREWTEPTSNDSPDIRQEMFSHFNYGKYNDYRQQLLASCYAPNRFVYNELHQIPCAEGFMSNVTNGLYGLGNIVGHILNLFRTGLFDGWRDFKRSELRAYVQSNEFTMLRFNSPNYSSACMSLELEVPEGMVSSYDTTLNALFAFLDELNLNEVSKNVLETADTILVSLRAQNGKFNDIVRDVYSDYSNNAAVENKFRDTERHMTTKRVDKMKFKEAYPGGFRELKDVVEKVITTGNSHLQSVASIHSRMEETEELMGAIAKLVDVKSIGRQQLDQLSKIARVWAYNFDKFATIINDVYRIDHNITGNIMQCRKFLEI